MAEDDGERQAAGPDGGPGRVTVSRRALLTGGGIAGIGLLGAGVAIGHEVTVPHRPPSPASGADPSPSTAIATVTPTSTPATRTYVSTSLTAPGARAWKTGETAEGLLFVGQSNDGFKGMIMDETGEPVWIAPPTASAVSPLNMTDIDVQTYQGKPVLTYWSGVLTQSHGVGECTILDSSYQKIATVQAAGPAKVDLHEFNLTDRGTALIVAFPTRPADLSSIGGPKNGFIYDCHAQEIEVATGKVLLDWSALDHIDVAETYLGLTQHTAQNGTTRKKAFDPFHMNAIDDDGDRLLISCRHTHTLYAIDRTAGTVLWRFGGRKSDFEIPSDAAFSWQHDARWRPDHGVSLFDNHHYSGTTGQSQGLWFTIDETKRTAVLKERFAYDRHMGTAMGNVQPLANGNVMVGWGWDAAATEFDPHQRPIYEMTLAGRSYRVFRHPWTGTPAGRPAIAARKTGDDVAVYLSWNGATEVAFWRVLAGGGDGKKPAAFVTPRTGFETLLRVASTPTVVAQALDRNGAVLATTERVTL